MKKKPAQKSAIKSTVTVERSNQFKSEIDLRGMTGDEAWSAVDKYFDEAQIAGFHPVRLVHGKGTGVLRKAVHAHLKSHKSVRTFRLGTFGEGEMGVTIAELK